MVFAPLLRICSAVITVILLGRSYVLTFSLGRRVLLTMTSSNSYGFGSSAFTAGKKKPIAERLKKITLAERNHLDMTTPPFGSKGLVRNGRQAGFLTCGSSFPYAFPAPTLTLPLKGRGMGWEASGLRVGSLSAYSGGTVMASHHLPLTLSSVKLNLPPYDQLSLYPVERSNSAGGYVPAE